MLYWYEFQEIHVKSCFQKSVLVRPQNFRKDAAFRGIFFYRYCIP